MTEQPLVSIVTPTFNQVDFLETALKSVLEQDYPRIEYIVCDAGSTDGSLAVLQRYANRLAWWCSEPDAGQSDAINKGFRHATGQILAWLNSDDVYLPGAIAAAVAAFQRQPSVGVIYGDLQVIDELGGVTGEHLPGAYDFSRLLTQQLIIPQPATFWRRELTDRLGLLRTDLHYAMDFELWLRLAQQTPFVHLPERLAQFRLSTSNKSVAQSARWGPEFLRILDDLFAQPGLLDSTRQLRRVAYAGAYFSGGQTYLTALDLAQARAWLWRAVRLNPRYLWSARWWWAWGRALSGHRINVWGRALKARRRAEPTHPSASLHP